MAARKRSYHSIAAMYSIEHVRIDHQTYLAEGCLRAPALERIEDASSDR